MGSPVKFLAGANPATPVIRGVLMTPQGVKASMDVTSGLSTSNILIASSKANAEASIRTAAYSKDFGKDLTADLAGYVVGEVDPVSQSFKLLLNGFSNTEHPAIINCSYDPDDDSYFAKVLNTDPTKIEEKGHYLYAHWSVDKNVAVPSASGLKHANVQLSGNYENMMGFVIAGAGNGSSDLPDYDSFEQRFQTAKTPWIVSQFTSVSDNKAARPATAEAGGAKKLFRLYSLNDGEVGNTQFRLLISDLRYNGANDYGTFTLSLEKFDSDPVRGETLISWKKADLNPDSPNFIGRLIGDEHTYYDFDLDSDKQRLKTKGSYALKNDYVRIELSDEVKQGLIDPSMLPAGFQGHSHLRTAITNNFVEQASIETAAANCVFTTDVGGTKSTILSSAEVLPLDYVKSISRVISGSTEEADSDLAWGVKLSVRENKDSGKKELVEQIFNHSVKSWTKFFPELGQSHAFETEGKETDQFQNSFFSLENIELGSDSASADWNGSKYVRKPALTTDRFVTISQDAKGGNVKYLKFRCLFQGGFDGVNIFDQEKAELTSVASVREGQDETVAQKFTGPTIMSYRRAIDVLSDKSAADFQLLSIPGQRASQVTDYAIDACEDRFDALLVMDVVEKTAETHHVELSSEKPHVRNTISSFEDRSLDTSFAAAYFPDVVIRRPSDSAPVIMPPSVGMMGVMSRNDSIADPWFAPAGLSRGRLGAIDSQVRMNRDLLDELYDADINPVYVPAGRSGEVYAFGQKTLLQDASALDRINVRRLLIDIRRKVKKVGEQLLFEPNRASTLEKFSALVEPIMANVQQRKGVERYKVQINTTTTTQNDVENNTIRGKIYLQPTKSVEFISLDFVVANTIQQ
jgi:phage tail sheath protein FI